MKQIIAVPSMQGGGQQAPVSAHFGHCELYTLLTVEDGNLVSEQVIPNVPHQQGGCMAPVQHLANHGVNVLLAGGMGMRPLVGFNQVGITVHFAGDSQTVKQALDAFLAGQLPEFTQQHTCGGGGMHPHAH